MNTIQHVIQESKQQLPSCHIEHALEIDRLLHAGKSYQDLKGKKIRCNPSLIRFKIGRGFRLIYQFKNQQLHAFAIVSRQHFEKQIKRR